MTEPAAVLPEPEPEPDVEVIDDGVPANVKRLRELIEVAKANRPDEAAIEEEGKDELEGEDEEFLLTEPADDDDHEPGPLWSMPEHPFAKAPVAMEEARPVTLSIVDPPAVDLAPVFVSSADLGDELESLAEVVKRSHLTTAQTDASRDIIRALRALLKG
jgi:hypothetical protein